MATTSNVIKSPRASCKPTGTDFTMFKRIIYLVYISNRFLNRFMFSLYTEKNEQRRDEGETSQTVFSSERSPTEAATAGETGRGTT